VLINYSSNEDAAKECQNLCRAAANGGAARFETFRADISRPDDRARLVAFAQKEGWIDLLVNNAGVAPKVRADLLEATEESFDRLIAINVKGPYFLSQKIAHWWLSMPDQLEKRARKPKIVTVTSISAYTASTNRGDYCVSKAALAMMTKLFAVRLADYGINVYELRPGIVQTDMTGPVQSKYDELIEGGLTPIRRWGMPEDVGLAVAAIAEGRFPFSTGQVIDIDGGFHLQRL
jgi:NAD(P)-dependent dehydrogenase (short-subunit alcohol dehydrogenase family)